MRLSRWLLPGRYELRSLIRRDAFFDQQDHPPYSDLDSTDGTTLTANRSSPSTTGITETTFCILC